MGHNIVTADEKIQQVSKTTSTAQDFKYTQYTCTYRKPVSLAKEDSLEIYTPEQSYILDAGTKTEKKVWLQKLRTRIAMALYGAEATEKNEIGNNENLSSVNRGYLVFFTWLS